MGKTSRKTKAKKKDFAKVKLRVGKRKAPPNNATETAFKSQSIYIPEQLKNVRLDSTQDNDGVSQQSQSIPDLLSQVGHFNPNSRIDALTALRVNFSNNRHLIEIHLPKIIEKTAKMIVDADRLVRRSNLALFKLLFSELAQKQIAPFFEVIISYVQCAMSHLNEDIQQDSLQILDLCIKIYPSLITNETQDSLLEHFIEMISTKQMSSAAKNKAVKKAAGPTRILSMKLSKKESSISWRLKILKRLLALLSTSEADNSDEKDTTIPKMLNDHFQDDKFVYNQESGIRVPWNSGKIGAILTCCSSVRLLEPSLILRANRGDAVSSLGDKNEPYSSPWKLITTLFPLLLDCWHEVFSGEGEQKKLSAEVVSTMKHVLDIILVLSKRFIHKSDDKLKSIMEIRSAYMKEFKKYFLSPFPFNHHQAREKANRHKGKESREQGSENILEDVRETNLLVCELVTLLSVQSELQNDAETFSSVAMYISSLLLSPEGRRDSQINPAVLQRVISTNNRLLEIAADVGTQENLLHPLFLFYQKVKGNQPLRMLILKFFLDLYSQENFYRPGQQNNSVMVEWICSLPGLLVSLISKKVKNKGQEMDHDAHGCLNTNLGPQSEIISLVLSCMRLASLRKNTEYMEEMKKKTNVLLTILDTSANALFCPLLETPSHPNQTAYCKDCEALQAQIFEVIIFHSPMCSEHDLAVLTHLCHHVTISVDNVYYVAEMLHQRNTKYSSAASKQEYENGLLSMYKFLCSILIGVTKEELWALQAEKTTNETYKLVGQTSEFKRHRSIVLRICKFLQTLDHAHVFLHKFICDKILKEHKNLPAKSIVGILESGIMLLRTKRLSETSSQDLLFCLSELCVRTMFGCYNTKATEKNDDIIGTVKATVTTFFKISPASLHCCIELLNTVDISSLASCETVCRIIGEMVMDLGLRESLLKSQGTISNILEHIKAEHGDSAEQHWFSNTFSSFSVMFSLKT